MDGEQRRKEIIEMMKTSGVPLSGTSLAKRLGVSRQVIVQDIALLRATNKNILSTNKGYILFEPSDKDRICKRVIAVEHTDEQTKDELYTIVDEGARVRDVIVEHELYGQITVDLLITSRKDVDEFVYKKDKSDAKALKVLTNDKHYHTVEAAEEKILDAVEKKLKEKGYLIFL